MKKVSLVYILLISASLALAQESMIQIRAFYYKAYEDESQVAFFKEYMDHMESNSTTIEGYRSASLIFMAKEGWNPMSKYAYFKSGKNKLDSVIDIDQKNIELRFLRYSIQQNAPAFLGYNDDLEKDKTEILSQFQHLEDTDLKTRISQYMLKNSGLTESERKHLLQKES